jgi:hypothetical protein
MSRLYTIFAFILQVDFLGLYLNCPNTHRLFTEWPVEDLLPGASLSLVTISATLEVEIGGIKTQDQLGKSETLI